jgi:hypothetical protein
MSPSTREVRIYGGLCRRINPIVWVLTHILRLNPPDGVGAFDSTGVPKKISYGQGDVSINGTIGLAEISIAGHTIPHQGQ